MFLFKVTKVSFRVWQLRFPLLKKPQTNFCCSPRRSSRTGLAGRNKSRNFSAPSRTFLQHRAKKQKKTPIVSHNTHTRAYGSNHGRMTCRACILSYAPVSPGHQKACTRIAQPWHDVSSRWCVSAAGSATMKRTHESAPPLPSYSSPNLIFSVNILSQHGKKKKQTYTGKF